MELFWLNAAFSIRHQALGSSQVGRHARANEHERGMLIPTQQLGTHDRSFLAGPYSACWAISNISPS